MRDVYFIFGMAGVALVIGSVLFFLGPNSFQASIGNALAPGTTNIAVPVQYTVLAQGQDAPSIAQRINYRITDQNDLESLWALIYDDNAPALPQVDFSRYEVLALFDGTHSTGGYQIRIESITDQNATRTIVIQHLAPDSSCQLHTDQTSPFLIIQVPKTVFSLTHADVPGVAVCP